MSYKQEACTACGKLIAPFETSVHFICPSCGNVTIWRCQRCQSFAREFKCPKCGFVGP